MDWWTEHGAEAVLSGVVAGAFATLGVWLTLRGQTRQSEVAAAVLAAAQLQGACIRATLTIGAALDAWWGLGRARINERVVATLADAAAAAFDARAAVLKRWPGMAAAVAAVLDQLLLAQETGSPSATPTERQARAMLLELQVVATRWLEDHSFHEE
jgi:hypothetical protein